jgi:hypothetical protein
MLRIDTSALDYLIIGLYFVTVLGVGFLARRLISRSETRLTHRPGRPGRMIEWRSRPSALTVEGCEGTPRRGAPSTT